MSIFFYYNGKYLAENETIITADNRALKYGDGLFETMKFIKGEISLKEYHFERLYSGMNLLQFDKGTLTSSHLEDTIADIARKNLHHNSAKIRLMILRGNGNSNSGNDAPDVIIQTWNLYQNEASEGLIIDIFPDARKSCDKFSNLKSNNFLLYAMAARYALKKKLPDCLLLNSYGRICDSTIANVFIIKNNVIYTPSLSEGCIAGVVRRWMLERFVLSPFKIVESTITIEDLKNADEIFFTNAIKGIMWVKQFGEKEYKNHSVKKICTFFDKTMLNP